MELKLDNSQLHFGYFGDFKGGKISVSPITGDLTIVKFQPTDAGFYECHSPGNEHYLMELKLAGEFTVYVSHSTQ